MFKLLSILRARADGFEQPGDNDFITQYSCNEPSHEVKGADDDPANYENDGFDSQVPGNDGFPMKNEGPRRGM